MSIYRRPHTSMCWKTYILPITTIVLIQMKFHIKNLWNISTGNGTRTHTGITAHQILSLMRLPIPPSQHRVLRILLALKLYLEYTTHGSNKEYNGSYTAYDHPSSGGISKVSIVFLVCFLNLVQYFNHNYSNCD